MAVKAINFKYDPTGQNSGIATPHTDAILNYYQSISGTGYFDGIGDGGQITAPIDYSVAGSAKLSFNLGAFLIYGRMVMIEGGTIFSVPLTSTSIGSIGIRVNLSLAAGAEAQLYSKLTQTLSQNNLLNNPVSGIYELELYRYSSNGSTLSLMRSPTLSAIYGLQNLFYFKGEAQHSVSGSSLDAIPKETYNVTTNINGKGISTIFESNGTTVKNATQATRATYASTDTSKGTIEQRLTNLGFRSGTVSLPFGTASVNYVYRQGNYVIGKVAVSGIASPNNPKDGATLFTVPINFRPKNSISMRIGCSVGTTGGGAYPAATLTINTSGTAVITSIEHSNFYRVISYDVNFGFEANPI